MDMHGNKNWEFLMKIDFSPPDIQQEDIELVVETLRSGWITTGPQTKRFETEIAAYCGTKTAACFHSATAAMELALRLMGIQSGDEVITSAYTYTASASVIAHVGARIVLVDTAPGSYQMDLDQLKVAITAKTKAIIAIDIAGIPANYSQIEKIVEEKRELFSARTKMQSQLGRVMILADAAHSFGAVQNELNSGLLADFTAFSFHAVKNLTTSEGGALTWRSWGSEVDKNIYRQLMLMSLHGQNKDALAKSKAGAWEYDIIAPYYKCNMTDICAALGISQLKRYAQIVRRRREIIEKYNSIFFSEGWEPLLHEGRNYSSSMHLYLLRIPEIQEKQRNEIIYLAGEAGISLNVHYKPLPMFTAYKNMGFSIENFPNAYKQYENEITLPLHMKLNDEEINYVTDTLIALGRRI